MEKGCLIGLDQGSSSTKAVVLDRTGAVLFRARRDLSPAVRDGLRVEQDPGEVLASVQQALDEAANAAHAAGHSLLGIGLSCQRSSCLAWDEGTGTPLSAVLSWRDTRGSGLVRGLLPQSSLVFERSGIPLTPYYAASKLRWLQENLPPARGGIAVLGTLSSFLCQRLTGSAKPLIDHTNAARTQLMAVGSLAWDRELISLFGLEEARLPEIVPTARHYGMVRTRQGPVSLLASLGDQQAALLGLGVLDQGQGCINYGTGGFLMVSTGRELRPVKGLMASVLCSTDDAVLYLVEGSVNAVGDGLEWLRANLGLYQDPSELEGLCRAARSEVVVFLGLNGIGAPHWEEEVPSAIQGLGPESTQADIVRGGVEGIAFFMADIAAALENAGIEPSTYTVSGGLSSLSYLLEAQTALLGRPLFVAGDQEASAAGAAVLAGVSRGIWTLQDRPRPKREASTVPTLRDPNLRKRYKLWQKTHRNAVSLLE